VLCLLVTTSASRLELTEHTTGIRVSLSTFLLLFFFLCSVSTLLGNFMRKDAVFGRTSQFGCLYSGSLISKLNKICMDILKACLKNFSTVPLQIDSVEALLPYYFTWILPGEIESCCFRNFRSTKCDFMQARPECHSSELCKEILESMSEKYLCWQGMGEGISFNRWKRKIPL
jgi:hypothetical protein